MAEHVFGSIDVAAEMAASMGMDPRPHLTEEQEREFLRWLNITKEKWDDFWDKKIQTPF